MVYHPPPLVSAHGVSASANPFTGMGSHVPCHQGTHMLTSSLHYGGGAGGWHPNIPSPTFPSHPGSHTLATVSVHHHAANHGHGHHLDSSATTSRGIPSIDATVTTPSIDATVTAPPTVAPSSSIHVSGVPQVDLHGGHAAATVNHITVGTHGEIVCHPAHHGIGLDVVVR